MLKGYSPCQHSLFWSPKCNNCPKCNKVLYVITFGPKHNKVLNVITFGPKCNKPPMKSFNCTNIEMLKWQLLHQRILWPMFMAYCRHIAGSLISIFLFAKDVGWEALATKPYTDVFLASNWGMQWERWSVALFISLAQTLKCNRFWQYTCVISAEVNTSWTELQEKEAHQLIH